MNNKVNNYKNYVIQKLEEAGTPFVEESHSPSVQDIKKGKVSYYCCIITKDISAIFSDCTEDGQMFYAISFRSVDEFLEQNFSVEEANEMPSFITLNNIHSFINIITNEATIRIFERMMKKHLSKDSNF